MLQTLYIIDGYPSYLCEFGEGCIGWVVGNQEAHSLISNLHWSRTVHNGEGRKVYEG